MMMSTKGSHEAPFPFCTVSPPPTSRQHPSVFPLISCLPFLSQSPVYSSLGQTCTIQIIPSF